MQRRNFLGLTGAAAISPVLGRLGTGAAGEISQAPRKDKNRITKIAGFTPEELLSQYREYLFDDFLPFTEKYVIDTELGGFFWNIDRDGTIISKKKRAWYDGRGIWVYSFLYNNLRKDPKYLDTA